MQGVAGRRTASNVPKYQVRAGTPFARGFAVISRLDEVRPRCSPILRALRSPDELRRAQETQQCPGSIIRTVARKTKRAARPQRPPDRRNRVLLDEPSLPVPALRPG